MLNWILWNGTVFDIENVLTLNWFFLYRTVLTFNCGQTKPVRTLNGIGSIRTVWLKLFFSQTVLIEPIVLKLKLRAYAKLNYLK